MQALVDPNKVAVSVEVTVGGFEQEVKVSAKTEAPFTEIASVFEGTKIYRL